MYGLTEVKGGVEQAGYVGMCEHEVLYYVLCEYRLVGLFASTKVMWQTFYPVAQDARLASAVKLCVPHHVGCRNIYRYHNRIFVL
jgi:hypothetical protein